jgi:hypothetical protein
MADGPSDAAHARNVGAVHARAPLLAFIDDDDLVSAGWLDALVTGLGTYPLIASSMEYRRLNAAAAIDGWPLTQQSSLRSLDGFPVSTGHVGIRRELWEQLGGQTEGLLVGEDMDLTLRAARDFGVPARLEPTAVYHRQLPTTLRGAYRQGIRDGRGRVQRAVMFSHRTDLSSAFEAYIWLITRSPYLITGRRRLLWALRFGERVGRAQESVKRRAFHP